MSALHEHSWMNGAYLQLGAVGHREHPQRDGRELGHGETIAARCGAPFDPGSQWSPARVDEFDDRAGRGAEPVDDCGAQTNRPAALDVEACTRHDANAQ